MSTNTDDLTRATLAACPVDGGCAMCHDYLLADPLDERLWIEPHDGDQG
jgi:hypothetical protein